LRNNGCDVYQSNLIDVYDKVAGAYVVGSKTTDFVMSQKTFESVSLCAAATPGASNTIESNKHRVIARIYSPGG
jgi:hypothetical protein